MPREYRNGEEASRKGTRRLHRRDLIREGVSRDPTISAEVMPSMLRVWGRSQ